MSQSSPSSDNSSNKWMIGGVLLIAAVVGISVLDDSNENEASSYESDALAAARDANSPDTTSASTLSSPSKHEITRAANHAGRAMGVMGGEGATFYSERCYEALELRFTAPALDRCYAFDLFAERLIEGDNAAYFYSHFWPANARARWDGAVLVSGLSQTDFESRRVALEKQIESVRVALIAPPPSPVYETADETLEGELVDPALAATDLGEPDTSSGTPISLDGGVD